MTNYEVCVYACNQWETIARFTEKANFDAMVQFCLEQFELGNSLSSPAENIAIVDAETGEVLWDWHAYYNGQYDDPEDDVDESNYDPYLGCDSFETEWF